MGTKISQDVATKEIVRWLDFKRIRDNKRKELKTTIKDLVEGVMDGTLVVDEKCNIIQKLQTPIEDDEGKPFAEKLTFKPRLKVKEIHKRLEGVEPKDYDGRVLAYVAELTGQSKGVVGNLETDDYTISQTIVVFFM